MRTIWLDPCCGHVCKSKLCFGCGHYAKGPQGLLAGEVPESMSDGLADPYKLLADWRAVPEILPDVVLIARGSGLRVREIARLAGLDRATIKRILKDVQ